MTHLNWSPHLIDPEIIIRGKLPQKCGIQNCESVYFLRRDRYEQRVMRNCEARVMQTMPEFHYATGFVQGDEANPS